MTPLKTLALATPTLAALLLLLTACSQDNKPGADQGAGNLATLSGSVHVDGSSTVFPISEAIAEEFQKVAPNVRVTVGTSGTGGGFKKFMAGEIDVSDASRPVKPEEIAAGKTNNIEYLELPIAYDGLSVVINTANTFVDHLTIEELKKIWGPGSTLSSWKDVRAGFPDKPIRLFGPGTDSGTFDYFTDVINGKAGASRPDYTSSEDDNVLVQGVEGDEGAIGYFGFAYYEANMAKLKLVPIDAGKGAGPIAPSMQTINDGTYAPLSRPLFIYVSKASAKRADARAFVDFYLNTVPKIAKDVGYVALPAMMYEEGKSAFSKF